MSSSEALLGMVMLYAVNKTVKIIAKNLKKNNIRKNSEIFRQISPQLIKIKSEIEAQGYLSTSIRKNIESQYADVFEIVNRFKEEFLDCECRTQKRDFLDFISNYNAEYLKKEKEACVDLFHIGKYDLDDEQQIAVVTDEDNNLVIAGAGSGKTLTIMGKVNYLVNRKKIDPKEILLIAFAKKAAGEMTSRIKSLEIDIEANTFHKLGLNIIALQKGERPKVAEDSFINDFLVDYFMHKVEDSDNQKDLFSDLVKYFAYYLNVPTCLEKCKSLGEMFDREKTMNLETLKSQVENLKEENTRKEKTIKGEQVRSLQEVEIANYLFLNGIEYDYERPYPYEVCEDDEDEKSKYRKKYTPDFCIYINGRKKPEECDWQKDCIWLEHFGISKDNRVPWLSDIEETKYLEGIKWKRELHKQKQTILEETYSYDFSEGTLGNKLETILKKYEIPKHLVDSKAIYNSLLSNIGDKYFHGFIEFCSTFITLFKSNGYKIEDLDNLTYTDSSYNSVYHRERKKLFKKIIKNIIIEYDKALKAENLIDFSDMIIEAKNAINNGFKLPQYKYVIIDEFQDIADGRAKLVKAIIDQTKAHLFCVGDDWQSIYRFTGSDVGIFLKFKEFFGATEQMNISNTYRNSQDLIDLASSFIQKNPDQIKKNLHSHKKCDIPVRFYMYSDEAKVYSTIKQAIDDFIEDKNGNHLMILGRTNYDKEILLKSTLFTQEKKNKDKEDKLIYVNDKDLDVEFLTVHRSKGLEADNVLILNFNNEKLGFPNKIADDPLLELVLSQSDAYPYAEERRLMYVALTRTKNRVALITNSRNASEFFVDLDDENYSVKINSDGEDILPVECPHCKTGHLIIRINEKTQEQFLGCTNYPKCEYTLKDISVLQDQRICPYCDGYLEKKKGKRGEFYGCSNYPDCTYTEDLEKYDEVDDF